MKINNEVMRVLSRASIEGCGVRLKDQLDRHLYGQVNKVLEAAGGRWNRKAGAHVFTSCAEARLDQILLTGEVVVPKDEFEFFPTPANIVDRMMATAEIKAGMKMLEPHAGRGNIAIPCAERGAEVHCIDLMPDNAKALAGDVRLASVVETDFLTVVPLRGYDAVLLNPPFSRQADIRHTIHALKFVRPGGVLVGILSAGVCFRDNALTRDFLDLISEQGGIIEMLPEGAFKASGTMVRTAMVTVRHVG